MGANSEGIAVFFREADAIASRIGEQYQYRLRQAIAAKERIIDIQVEKTSIAKATQLATYKLNKLQEWNQAMAERRSLRHKQYEQTKEFLFWLGAWVGSGRSGAMLFFSGIITSTILGLVAGINLPTAIACRNNSEICYLLRVDKDTVVIPQEFKKILGEYERNKNKFKRRN